MKTFSFGELDRDSYLRVQREFLARGETAWSEYQRTGQSCPAAEVFEGVEARIALRRRELASRLEDDHGDR